MIINVDTPLKQQEIIELLEAQEKPVYKYLGQGKLKTQLQFEVSEAAEGMDVPAYTKKLIKSQPYGGQIYFRVVEEGKYW
ncbi:MAG: hypothetical protein IJF87_03660 [Erysipelotrichaceae bacterium]|nr:hypothetical protein [Erysipelotrichaceae bacterium]